MTGLLHDPIPDGKTGPFTRKPHLKLTPEGAGYAYDERCPRCQLDKAFEVLLEVAQRDPLTHKQQEDS
jgi:hypothetical protein